MASQVVGSQKYASLEVVDSLKLDNEVTFNALTMDGTDLDVLVSGAFSVVSSSTVTATPSINLSALENVLVYSSSGDVSVLGGLDDTVDSNGSVALGHRLAVDGTAVAVVKVDWVGGVNHLGFFGSTPAIKHASTGNIAGFVAGAGVAAQDVSVYTGGVGATAYTVGDIVRALKNYGLMTV